MVKWCHISKSGAISPGESIKRLTVKFDCLQTLSHCPAKTFLEKNHKATKERFAERQDLGVDQKKLKENSFLNDGTHGEKKRPT